MTIAILITGASRGFGQAVAVSLSSELSATQKAVDLFLWARSRAKLEETRIAVEAAARNRGSNIVVSTAGVDLSDQTNYVPKVDELVQQLKSHEPAYESVYIVHNAASVGQLGSADVWQSAGELASYWELNLNSVCFLNAKLLAAFKNQPSTRIVLANISSNVAVTPFSLCGLYCTGKAAREMHFRVIAEETKANGCVRVVNYWPGALDTEMQDELRESKVFPPEIRAIFEGFKNNGELARAEDSAQVLVEAIVADAYATGSTIEYKSSNTSFDN